MPTRRILLALVLFSAQPMFAAIAGRDLYIPVVGRAAGVGGREYLTSVFITNLGDSPADVTLSFIRAAQEQAAPVHARVQVAPHGALAYEMDDALVGGAGVGALRLQSREQVSAVARTYSRASGAPAETEVGASFEAIPAERAIGNGESTSLPGVQTAVARYKVYAVEVAGQAVHVELTLLGADGRASATRRLFIRANEMRAWDLASELGLTPGAEGVVRVSCVNGSGKVIVAGERIANGSFDGNAFNMIVPLQPRTRLSSWEIALYAVIAISLVVSVLVARRR